MRERVPLTALLLATAAATFGCYESDFPLGPPTQAVDAGLLGTWRCVQHDSESQLAVLELTVARRSEQQYDVSLAAAGEETLLYRGHATDLRGTTILNLQELKPGKAPDAARWDFVRATLLKPNVLDVAIVDDKLFPEKPATAAAQRAAMEASVARPELFSDYCVCARLLPR